MKPDDTIQAWKFENEAILVGRIGEVPVRIDRIDLATGTRTHYREAAPPDRTGVVLSSRFILLPGGETYGYTSTISTWSRTCARSFGRARRGAASPRQACSRGTG